jgi:3-deoxy-manno-octulosonate cytidylyltransferase (CMP-KDO synthetase)
VNHLVIPLRSASQRIPEKIYTKIQGRELLLRMADHAQYFQEEIVDLQCHLAVDSEKAVGLLDKHSKKIAVHLTDPNLPSGTDRVCDVLKRLGAGATSRGDWIINVQGDMPFLCRSSLALFITALKSIPEDFGMATMTESFQSIEDYQSSGVVKVITGSNGRSIYFSRLPIPYGRQEIPSDPKKLIGHSHIGVYAYRPNTLLELAALPPHQVELAEGLEQLRALAAGIQIYAWHAEPKANTNFRGIDLPSDLAWAQSFKI